MGPELVHLQPHVPYARWTSSYVPSLSLAEAVRRGYAWAVRRATATKAAGIVGIPAAAELTDADRSFLRWLAQAAIALSMSENGSKVEE